jgi:hypothetical protein
MVTAMIHGYRYTFMHVAEKPADRYVSWVKVPAMIEHLKGCKFILFVESDGIFTELTLPLEWQMNYWNFTPTTKVAMPIDPEVEVNLDWNGNLNLNLGFVIGQNTPRTFEIWEAWNSCIDDQERFPDCEKWRYEWPREQGAYSSIIRYKYNEPDDLLVIPCEEANGNPEELSECNGALNYQHYWTKKDLAKGHVVPPMMQTMMQSLQLDFLMQGDEVVQRKQGYDFGINSGEEIRTGKT